MNATMRERILNGPAARPPPGFLPDFSDPPNIKNSGIAIVVFCAVFPTLMMVLQLYTKTKYFKKFHISDYFLYAAFIIYMGALLPLSIKIVTLPIGIHQWNMRVRQMIDLLYWLHWASVAQWFVFAVLKVAIILQIIMVFVPHGQRGFTFWGGHVLIWVTVVLYFILLMVNVNVCEPKSKAWDVTIQGGKCLNTRVVYVASASFNSFSDLLMLLLPQRDIWKLHMTAWKKAGISAVFSVGLLACIVSAVRTYYTVVMLTTPDVSYYAAVMALWGLFEMVAGFVVACLPVIPRLLRTSSLTGFGSTLQKLLHPVTSLFSRGSRSEDSTVVGEESNIEKKVEKNISYNTLGSSTVVSSGTIADPRSPQSWEHDGVPQDWRV